MLEMDKFIVKLENDTNQIPINRDKSIFISILFVRY